MREIKFRAWSLADRSWCGYDIKGFVSIDYNNKNQEIFGYFPKRDGIVVMQYTGLKDEGGVEIYEGDVFGLFGGDLERPNEYEFHAKVYFDNDFSAFCVELYNGGWEYLSDYLDNPKNEREVIGNIYENPELVK